MSSITPHSHYPPWQIAIESLTEENYELREILDCNRTIIRACIHALHDETQRGDALKRQNRELVDDYRQFRERIMLASLPGDDA